MAGLLAQIAEASQTSLPWLASESLDPGRGAFYEGRNRARKGEPHVQDRSRFVVLPYHWRSPAPAQAVRGAFPSPSIQILPLMVATERGFFKREGLDLELVFVRGATVAVQALLANQIHFIFSIGPQMPAVWEGNDIMLLAQQVGRPTFSLVVTPDIQKIADLKGKKLGVTFGGSTAAGTKALLELNKINPDKDVEYISLPGNEPKIAAMKQGIISGGVARAAVGLSWR